jgi:hypothetical protein
VAADGIGMERAVDLHHADHAGHRICCLRNCLLSMALPLVERGLDCHITDVRCQQIILTHEYRQMFPPFSIVIVSKGDAPPPLRHGGQSLA